MPLVGRGVLITASMAGTVGAIAGPLLSFNEGFSHELGFDEHVRTGLVAFLLESPGRLSRRATNDGPLAQDQHFEQLFGGRGDGGPADRVGQGAIGAEHVVAVGQPVGRDLSAGADLRSPVSSEGRRQCRSRETGLLPERTEHRSHQ